MRITIGGREVLSQQYRSFHDLLDEYINHETERGRRVPDYEPGILFTAIAIYLLKKAVDEAMREIRERMQRSREEALAQEQRELEEKQHSELLDKMDELKQAMQDAAEASRATALALLEDDAAASALLRWARKENVRIDIVLETEAEGDLKEAFEAITKDVPGSLDKD